MTRFAFGAKSSERSAPWRDDLASAAISLSLSREARASAPSPVVLLAKNVRRFIILANSPGKGSFGFGIEFITVLISPQPFVIVSSRLSNMLPMAVQAASSLSSKSAGLGDSPTLSKADAAFLSLGKFDNC